MTFDIKAFEDFCRSKPADEEYDYFDTHGDNGGCPAFQYLSHLGLSVHSVSSGQWFERSLFGRKKAHELPPAMQATLHRLPHTWAALADRLAALRVSA